MKPYVDAFLAGTEVVLDPYAFLSLNWWQAAIGMRVCLGLCLVGIVWVAIRRHWPPQGFLLHAILLGLLVWGGVREVKGDDPLVRFIAHRSLELFSVAQIGILFVAGLAIGSRLRLQPRAFVFLAIGVVAGTILALRGVASIYVAILLFCIVGFNAFLTGCVLTELLDIWKPELTHNEIGPWRILLAGIAGACLVATLVPQQHIRGVILAGAPGIPLFGNPATGEVFPPEPLALLAVVRQQGIMGWIFPAALILGFVSNVPGRFLRRTTKT